MRKIEIEVDGVVSTATLKQAQAPGSTDRLWDALPLQTRLIHAIRSGNCAETRVDELADTGQRVENQVSFFYPGMLAYQPSTGELTFAYGQGQARSETGTHWVSYIGDIDPGGEEIYQAWERTRSVGASTVQIRRKEST